MGKAKQATRSVIAEFQAFLTRKYNQPADPVELFLEGIFTEPATSNVNLLYHRFRPMYYYPLAELTNEHLKEIMHLHRWRSPILKPLPISYEIYRSNDNTIISKEIRILVAPEDEYCTFGISLSGRALFEKKDGASELPNEELRIGIPQVRVIRSRNGASHKEWR